MGGFHLYTFPRGNVRVQKMDRYGQHKWDNADQLWWTGAKPGAKLDLKLQAPQTGTYAISVRLTKARDYAIVQFSLDGKKLGPPIDLYNPQVIPTEPMPLGTHRLEQGLHKLTVEIVGANEQAVPSYMFGLDVIDLELQTSD